CLALGIAGCSSLGRDGPRESGEQSPVVDRSAAAAAALASYLEVLQQLMQSGPAEQAEIVVAAQREFELAPTASHQLRYALALAAPGHAASDLPTAQRLLRELLASPETLLPAERALAQLELMKVDRQLLLAAENRRLQTDASRVDRDRVATVNRRLQAEIEENARLRKALDEAQAKLDAIANIERSINDRNSNSEGRQP
ncbi:MAG TPA: hypothetical protein VJ011_02095, partial [Steroidobacteraceae bacterium]|nr:hypothetical protein [Steroidobacteraceae bacterium]